MEVDSAPQPGHSHLEGGQSHLEGGQSQHAPGPVLGGSSYFSRGGHYRACRDDGIPGPIYRPASGVYRDGRDKAPSFTMAGRSPLPQTDRNLASQYSGTSIPEGSSKHRRSPAYSFGSRFPIVRPDACSPGPNVCPEQGVFRDGREGSPHFSLCSRPKDLSRYRTPGPAAYSPEKVTVHKPRAPKYTFGTKPCPYPSVFLLETTESSND